MNSKIVTIFIALIFFIAQPVNISKADLASDLLKKAQELAEKKKIKGKKLEAFILSNIIIVDYEGKEQTYKFNKDITYEVYENGKVIGDGTWTIKGLTKSSIKLSGYRDIYFQIYSAKDKISTLTNLKKKNDGQTNRKILRIVSSNDFEEQFAQIELEKQKALEQKKKAEEEKKQAALKAEEEKKQATLKAEEERKKKEEQEKLKAELDKLKAEKLAELESYKKSNEQLVEKAKQISELLVTLENDREGEKLIDEYNSQIENILTLETKVQIEAFKIDTEIHLSLKAYVEKHEGNISSYQTKIEEVEKQKKIEEEKKKLEEEKKQAALKAEEERKKIEEEKKQAALKKEQEKKEKEFLESYAGTIDGYQDVKFGMKFNEVNQATKNCQLKFRIEYGDMPVKDYLRLLSVDPVWEDWFEMLNANKIATGSGCYQIMSSYPEMYFGFDSRGRLISVATEDITMIDWNSQADVNRYKKLNEHLHDKYNMWIPKGTEFKDWQTFATEYDAGNVVDLILAFEEGQVVLFVGNEHDMNLQSTGKSRIRMMYFSKNNQTPKNIYTNALNHFKGITTGEGL